MCLPPGLSERKSFLKEDGMLANPPSRLPRRRFFGALLLTLSLTSLAAAGDGQDGMRCQLEPGGESTVLAVTGPQTLHLADGRLI